MEDQLRQTLKSFYDLEVDYLRMRQSVALETLDLQGPENSKNIALKYSATLLLKVLQDFKPCIIVTHLKQHLNLVQTKSQDAKQCPHCNRWALKQEKSCNFIFACGLSSSNIFVKDSGCGKSWCFECGKKFCGQYIDLVTCKKSKSAIEEHTSECCPKDTLFSKELYCSGGHDSHCKKRW